MQTKFIKPLLQLMFIILTLLCVSIARADFQVSNLTDFTLPEADTHNVNRITNSLCVSSKNPTVMNYQVQIYSNADGGKFEMTNGVSKLPYQVKWSSTGNNIFVDLQPNQLQPGVASKQANCSNVNLQIVIAPQDVAKVTSGLYSTVLNIVISPQ